MSLAVIDVYCAVGERRKLTFCGEANKNANPCHRHVVESFRIPPSGGYTDNDRYVARQATSVNARDFNQCPGHGLNFSFAR